VTYQGRQAVKKLKARWDGTAWYIPKYISNEEKQKLRKKYNPKQVKTSSKQVKSISLFASEYCFFLFPYEVFVLVSSAP